MTFREIVRRTVREYFVADSPKQLVMIIVVSCVLALIMTFAGIKPTRANGDEPLVIKCKINNMWVKFEQGKTIINGRKIINMSIGQHGFYAWFERGKYIRMVGVPCIQGDTDTTVQDIIHRRQ